MTTQENASVTQEQIVYAQWLDWGMRVGFIFTVATFFVYVFGIFPPQVPFASLPQLWVLPVEEYVVASGVHVGWGWLALVNKGDIVNFLPVALLSFITVLCFARIIPIFVKAKDRSYMAISFLEIAILLLSASGILVGGH